MTKQSVALWFHFALSTAPNKTPKNPSGLLKTHHSPRCINSFLLLPMSITPFSPAVAISSNHFLLILMHTCNKVTFVAEKGEIVRGFCALLDMHATGGDRKTVASARPCTTWFREKNHTVQTNLWRRIGQMQRREADGKDWIGEEEKGPAAKLGVEVFVWHSRIEIEKIIQLQDQEWILICL